MQEIWAGQLDYQWEAEPNQVLALKILPQLQAQQETLSLEEQFRAKLDDYILEIGLLKHMKHIISHQSNPQI